MSIAELPQPGTEVIQVFRTTSPTILRATLSPVVVGVCRQVIEVLASGALNPEAQISLPAQIIAKPTTGPTYKYAGLNGTSFSVSINGGIAVSVPFTAPTAGMSASLVVKQVNAAFTTAGVTNVRATVIGNGWALRSVALGDGQTLEITVVSSGAVTTAFGLEVGRFASGVSLYDQTEVQIPSTSYPDPRNNLSQLKIEPETVRPFLSLGTVASAHELKTDQAFLRGAWTQSKAITTGTVDLTTAGLYGGGGTLDGKTLVIASDGASPTTVTFTAPANAAAVLSTLNSMIITPLVATEQATTNFLVLTSTIAGPQSQIHIVSGNAAAVLGLTVGSTYGHATVEALDDHNGDQVTPMLAFYDSNGAIDLKATTTVASAAVITGAGVPTTSGINGKTLIINVGRFTRTIQFAAVSTTADIVSQINAAFPPLDGLVASIPATHLVLTSTVKREDGVTAAVGSDSTIAILGGTAVNGVTNYLDNGSTPTIAVGRTKGNPLAVHAGDEVWVDGTLLGTVLQVAPGSVSNVLKLDVQVSNTFVSTTGFYIVAKNLQVGGGDFTRPKPEVIVDGLGNTIIKGSLLRDVQGRIAETVITAADATLQLLPSKSRVYLAYKAIRKDVTADATNPGLLSFTDSTMINSLISPVSTDNPLALGAYFAQLNGSGVEIFALGVDDADAANPDGTVEAWQRALEFLERADVYGIAPLTQDQTVGQLVSAHVTTMSAPENKSERIAMLNFAEPTRQADTLVASGTSGNGTADTARFDTGIPNLSALLLPLGIDAASPIAALIGLFLRVEGSASQWSVSAVSGSVVTVRKQSGDFDPGENDDAFYATTVLPSGLIDVAFNLAIRGAELVLPDGRFDKVSCIRAIQSLGRSYGNRRVCMVFPERVSALVGGIEQSLKGYYACAGYVGAIAQQLPQLSFTGFPISGFTGAIGSSKYSSRQLNQIAAGGIWILTQDGVGLPLYARHALTTNMSTVEQRTDSITKVVDYTAKFLRVMLRGFIGRYNIVSGFLDTLSHVVQGGFQLLSDTGILVDGKMNNIIQDADQPDAVSIDCLLDVPVPCNYIRLTLTI